MSSDRLHHIYYDTDIAVLHHWNSIRKSPEREGEGEKRGKEKESEHIELQMCINCSKMTTNTIEYLNLH